MFGFFNNKKKSGSANDAFNRLKFMIASPQMSSEMFDELYSVVIEVVRKYHPDFTQEQIDVCKLEDEEYGERYEIKLRGLRE